MQVGRVVQFDSVICPRDTSIVMSSIELSLLDSTSCEDLGSAYHFQDMLRAVE